MQHRRVEKKLADRLVFTAADITIETPDVDLSDWDWFEILIRLSEGGTVPDAAGVTMYTLVVDQDDNEYIVKDGVLDAISLLGTSVGDNLAYPGRALGQRMKLRFVSTGELSTTNYLILSASLVLYRYPRG